VIQAVRNLVPKNIPVSAKLRLGWEQESDIVENVKRVEQAGANWVTIHARTRMQAYQPPAHWKWIYEARRSVQIPVIANGDLWTLEDFERCREITGCKHYMLGRGVFARPELSWQMAERLGVKALKTQELSKSFELFSVLRHYVTYLQSHCCTDESILRKIKVWIRYCALQGTLPETSLNQLRRASSLIEAMGVIGKEE
jgi:tRNA-dihydrouridine synthase C